MTAFTKLPLIAPIKPVLDQLAAHPELWDQHTARKVAPGSPHVQMSDIWVRYRRFDELTEPARYLDAHLSTWYPAWPLLAGLRPIVFGIMAHVQAVQLGGMLITRIPPGGQILPHHDRGSWHSEFYNCKVYVPLQSNEQCINVCEDERVSMLPGEVWTFDNLRVHAVENNSDRDRMTAIICMRVE